LPEGVKVLEALDLVPKTPARRGCPGLVQSGTHTIM
jgi:hypothetical protein